MPEEKRKTQLYNIHVQTAKMTEFAGFVMPLLYKGINLEHLAVRENVGVFDISHMGRVMVTGTDAERFLNYIVTNDVSRLAPNAAQYSVMCNESGGIIDDFVVYRLEQERFLVVFNAGNREKDYKWLLNHSGKFSIKLDNISDDVAMFAVQGPKAANVLQKISTEDLNKIERFKCGSTRLSDTEAYVARTGYTGEDGFEVFIWKTTNANPDNAIKVWNALFEVGKKSSLEPCGLGARDTLRLEAGLCLYGNDIDETISPLEAGLGFIVKLQKDTFIGKEALQKQKDEGVGRKRVGIQMTEQGIPRAGFGILDENNQKIGDLTSGTFSPLLKIGIGMGYVKAEDAQEQKTVKVKIREKPTGAKIVSFPFYDSDKYGSKRRTL
jgi:aminomethyltransferase